jgi:hypothetical protein
MIRDMRVELALLAMALSGVSCCAQTSVAPVAVNPGRVVALGGGHAFANSNVEDATFVLWRVDASVPRWTKIVLPAVTIPGVTPNPDPARVWSDVETNGSQVVLLGISDGPGERHQTLMQATSMDQGATWRTSQSTYSTNGGFDSIQQYSPIDANHAWLLMIGSPGAGQLPAALFTTANGGKLWTKVQDASDEHVTMPIGSNGSLVLHPESATSAWFVSTCGMCDGAAMLNASYTVDAGRTFHKVRLSTKYPCGRCVPMGASDASSATANCFNTMMLKEGSESRPTLHFCTANNGVSWAAPVAGRGPGYKSPIVSTQCTEMPKDAAHKDSWSKCALRESFDGGKTFKTFLPELTAHGVTEVLSVSAKGDDVWAVVGVMNASNLLVYSGDKGSTWKVLTPSARP